jgi:hypothetical protein
MLVATGSREKVSARAEPIFKRDLGLSVDVARHFTLWKWLLPRMLILGNQLNSHSQWPQNISGQGWDCNDSNN